MSTYNPANPSSNITLGRLAWRTALFALMLSVVGGTPAAHAAAKDAPNIIIIMADDLGWNDVGYHGSDIATPHLDRLAAEGAQLTRFYVNSVCSPTRASLLTGLSSVRLGITSPMPKITPTGLPLVLDTLPEYLRQLNYQTHLVGKWHLGVKRPYQPNQRGFDSFYGNLGGAVGYYDHVHGGHYDWQRDGKTVRETGYATHLQADEAVRILRAHDAEQPLFMFLSLAAPHLPNEAPQAAIDAYAHIEDERRRIHAAMVSEMDTAIGRVLRELDAQGITENTLVWFMSDNGGLTDYRSMPAPFYRIVDTAKWIFGDNIPIRFIEFMRTNTEDGGSDNTPLKGAKGAITEGGIRVPAIISWPGSVQSGKFETRFSIVDVLPTLLDIAGDKTLGSQPVDGQSYWPALSGAADMPHAPFITEAFNGTIALFHEDWKMIITANGDTALYNIQADPTESVNLAAMHGDVIALMRARLMALPKGKNLAVPLWKVAIDPDEFGGEEREPPLAELYD